MNKPNDKDLEQKFANWLEGNQQFDEFEDLDSEEKALWQQRMSAARYLAHQAEMTTEQDVPRWNREHTFEQERKSWWQWGGLPAMSMAFSLFALSLVLFRVEFIMQDDGLMISFAGSNNQIQERKLAELVDQKLQTFASEQQVMLANYAADIKVKQQDNNLQLASYILGASRKERKEDLNDFIQYVNDQRADEQLNNRIKFQQLETALFYRNSDKQQLKARAASWQTEE